MMLYPRTNVVADSDLQATSTQRAMVGSSRILRVDDIEHCCRTTRTIAMNTSGRSVMKEYILEILVYTANIFA